MTDIYFDGGTDGTQICAVIDTVHPKTFEATFEARLTNNELEYKAIQYAMQMTLGYILPQPVTFIGDSEVIIKHLKGEYAVKAPNLLPLWRETKELQCSLESRGFAVTFKWVPRHANKAGVYIEHKQKLAKKQSVKPVVFDEGKYFTGNLEDKIKARLHRLVEEWDAAETNETFLKLLVVELLALMIPIDQKEIEHIYKSIGATGIKDVMEVYKL